MVSTSLNKYISGYVIIGQVEFPPIISSQYHSSRKFNIDNNNYTEEIQNFLNSPCPMEWPIKHIKPKEVREEVAKHNSKKSPGYDCITGRVIQNLSKKAILYLTFIFICILRLNHVPSQWKCAEVIMIYKPGKPENDVTLYRPISLLVILSKIFGRIFRRRMQPILEKANTIPEYQLTYYRIIYYIRKSLESKKYCSVVFLDVQQAFDKVWHEGLLFKLKKLLPTHFYLILKSYLSNRHYYVKYSRAYSNIFKINAGVPLGSVLGPVLYTIFTSDLPVIGNILVATYANDTDLLYAAEIVQMYTSITTK